MFSIQSNESPVGTIEISANLVGVAFSRPYGTARRVQNTGPSDESMRYYHAVSTGHFSNVTLPAVAPLAYPPPAAGDPAAWRRRFSCTAIRSGIHCAHCEAPK